MTDQLELRRNELFDQIGSLLEQYADVLGSPEDEVPALEMPVVGEWVLLAAIDDAGHGKCGRVTMLRPPHEFHHRIVGLLTMALSNLSGGH